MPMPVNSNWRKRSIADLRLAETSRALRFDKCFGLSREGEAEWQINR
jgi:hypothetical protein